MFIQQLVQLTINLESPHISHFVVAKSPYLGIRAFLVVDISFYSFLKSHDQLVYSKVMEKMVKSLGSYEFPMDPSPTGQQGDPPPSSAIQRCQRRRHRCRLRGRRQRRSGGSRGAGDQQP
jgi:hypothetical protein